LLVDFRTADAFSYVTSILHKTFADKIISVSFVVTSYLKTDMPKFESWQRVKGQAWMVDIWKAYNKPRRFIFTEN